MPEQIFKAPGVYDREIDLTVRQTLPSGIPAGIAGAAVMGPAFAPVELGSYADFEARFGPVNPKLVAGYAVQKWLEVRNNVWFVRVLGAGSNALTVDFEATRTKGLVKNAGMQITGSTVAAGIDARHAGAVQFLAAKHKVTASEAFGYPMFSDNRSYTLSGNFAYGVRGVIFTTSDARVMVFDTNENFGGLLDDAATIDDTNTNATYRKFKLAISSSAGSTWAADDGFAGVKIFTASLNPSADDYVGKRLNTDPEKYVELKHLFYADFAVDDELACVASGSGNNGSVVILSGSGNTSGTSGDSTIVFRDAFGRYDTRYSTPRTPWIISQPFGGVEINLFYLEAISDGEASNSKFKISFAGIKASTDPRNQYGSFTVIVRSFDDTDYQPKVLEQFNNVSLNPDADNYIAKVIGDTKFTFNFDVESEEDRRLTLSGKNPNKSKYIRVVMNDQVDRKTISALCLPFGFRGPKFLLTNPNVTDTAPLATITRLAFSGAASVTDTRLTGSIIPPLPFRFKVTRGEITGSATFTGQPGPTEVPDSRLYWGIKFERNNTPINTNVSQAPNRLLASLTQFIGLEKLDVLATGSLSDAYNDNKFTLARVALSNATLSTVTASVNTHMKDAAYLRNVDVDVTNYYGSDGSYGNRVTFATLLNKDTASNFNRFVDYMKFTTILLGGWDGINIVDKSARRFDDRSTSAESSSLGYGLAHASYTSPGATSGVNYSGIGINNNSVFAYRTATNILTDTVTSRINVLSLPGQRDPLVTDYAAQKNKDYDLSFYPFDIPYYDFNDVRIFDGEVGRFVDVRKTATHLDSRAIDNDSISPYFPNFILDDTVNNRRVTAPASVAALAAIGFNDKVSYPWFAPAGFNRAALSFVVLTQVRITQPERDALFDARINPIVKFPGEGYVFFSQNTLKQGKSLLSSTNVKRMVLEVKRLVADVGNRLLFDGITPALRNKFVSDTSSLLSVVQSNRGVEAFRIICDETNNTLADLEANRINGRIQIVPTTSVEYIAIDFILTNAGTKFV